MKTKLLVGIILVVVSSFFLYSLYKFLYTPRIVFGAKGFTEYSPNSNGRVFIQVLDNYFSPVDNAVCYINVYYPNGSYFARNQTMLHFENGLYYYDFIAPKTEGVYMVTVSCVYPSQLTVLTPSNSRLWYKDSTVVATDSLTTTIYPPSDASGNSELILYFTRIDANVDIYINNTQTNSWDYLGTATVNTPQYSSTFNLDTHNPITVYLTSSKTFNLDMLNVYVYTNTTKTQTNIRGGGEIHIEVKKVQIEPDYNPEVRPIS